MSTFPVLGLLFYDLIVFVGAIVLARKSADWKKVVLTSILFLFSGMPALIYQIVWQRALFMGASLPLLVEHLLSFSRGVAESVAILYFVNTFGSAVACYLCATFLLHWKGSRIPSCWLRR
jgi:hypothetical protein